MASSRHIARRAGEVTTTQNAHMHLSDSRAGGGPPSDYPKGDSPEFVAGLILQAIEEGGAKYFANEHLKQLAGAWPHQVRAWEQKLIVSPSVAAEILDGSSKIKSGLFRPSAEALRRRMDFGPFSI
jgi:hypothetical protein